MDILSLILAEKIAKGDIRVEIAEETVAGVEKECMAILGRIKRILEDDSLDDPECFERIERIVNEMESIGINCGLRHDFG